MTIKPDGTPVDRDAAAHRRWLITLVATVVFGVFGAVMAYLSYSNSSKPAAVSPNPNRAPSKSPIAAPSAEPATPAPAAVEPTSDTVPGNKGQGPKDK